MSGPRDAEKIVANAFEKMRLPEAQRHVFLCAGPRCCAEAEGQATWELLKRRLAELKIPVLRTKAACLRICQGGPWLLVYPEGVWYGAVTPERCERIITEHLVAGMPVTEWIVQQHRLE